MKRPQKHSTDDDSRIFDVIYDKKSFTHVGVSGRNANTETYFIFCLILNIMQILLRMI